MQSRPYGFACYLKNENQNLAVIVAEDLNCKHRSMCTVFIMQQ